MAKLTYDSRDAVELALRAAVIARQAGINAAEPLPTRDGALTVLVRWPGSMDHPLSLLRYAPGRAWVWRASAQGQHVAGTMLAILHATWSHAGLDAPRSLLAYLSGPSDGLLEADRVGVVVERALAMAAGSECVIYGDGLQLRRHGSEVAVIDWGPVSTGWRMFDVAIQVGAEVEVPDPRAHPFIAAYLERDASLADELHLLHAHQALVAAWQARFSAWAAQNTPRRHHRARLERYLDLAERRLAAASG